MRAFLVLNGIIIRIDSHMSVQCVNLNDMAALKLYETRLRICLFPKLNLKRLVLRITDSANWRTLLSANTYAWMLAF